MTLIHAYIVIETDELVHTRSYRLPEGWEVPPDWDLRGDAVTEKTAEQFLT